MAYVYEKPQKKKNLYRMTNYYTKGITNSSHPPLVVLKEMTDPISICIGSLPYSCHVHLPVFNHSPIHACRSLPEYPPLFLSPNSWTSVAMEPHPLTVTRWLPRPAASYSRGSKVGARGGDMEERTREDIGERAWQNKRIGGRREEANARGEDKGDRRRGRRRRGSRSRMRIEVRVREEKKVAAR